MFPKRWSLLISMAVLSGCQIHSARQELFHGMWRIDRYEILDSVSRTWIADANRKGYTAYVIYDGKGHMGVQQLHDDPLQTNAYFGNYTVHEGEDVIEHHKLSSSREGQAGTTVIRDFEWKGDTLILVQREAYPLKLRIRWTKCKS